MKGDIGNLREAVAGEEFSKSAMASADAYNAIINCIKALWRGDNVGSGSNVRKIGLGNGYLFSGDNKAQSTSQKGSSVAGIDPFTVTLITVGTGDSAVWGLQVAPGFVYDLMAKYGTHFLDATPFPPVTLYTTDVGVYIRGKIEGPSGGGGTVFRSRLTAADIKTTYDISAAGETVGDSDGSVQWSDYTQTTGYFYIKLATLLYVDLGGDNDTFNITQKFSGNIHTIFFNNNEVQILT